MPNALRYFGVSLFITIASIFIAYFELGWGAVFTIIVLIAVEFSFSFDNAIINAKVLTRLSRFWQQLFLTVGMLIAIVGMRFVFPIVIVMVTASLSWSQVVDAALNQPKLYGEYLEAAHYTISSFGGAFLLTLVLYFFFDKGRKDLWIRRIEKPLQRFGGNVWIPPATAAILIAIVAYFTSGHTGEVLRSGLFGVALYTVIKLMIEGLSKVAGQDEESAKRTKGKAAMYTGWSAFLAFMYLEVLDASFSFDGVLGAFAITNNILLIALGLGVGAIWVRSLTIYMVRKGTLETYKYLEHGAHYAIFALTLALFGSLFIKVPEVITGSVGIGIILSSYIASREAARDGKKLIEKI